MTKSNLLKSPWLEAAIMLIVMVLSFGAITIINMTENSIANLENTSMLLFAFFILSVAIALVSVIAGIGGGVIFTPIMLAFTNVDSSVVKATGLIVAMFSGLISTGIFMKKGLGNFKLCITLTVSQGVGAFLGASASVVLKESLGNKIDGPVNLTLGIILFIVAIYFLAGGKKIEHPVVRKVDRVTQWLKLTQPYYEESEKRVIDYQMTRILLGLLLCFFVGVLGGFFGMGAGWAITPVQNLAVAVPLKAAAANSGIILGIVDCIAVWPYLLSGAIIPLFVLPWLSGQVIGGYLGALLLVKIKVAIARFILIGIMIYTTFGLVIKGLFQTGVIAKKVPEFANLIVLGLVSVFVVSTIVYDRMKKENV